MTENGRKVWATPFFSNMPIKKYDEGWASIKLFVTPSKANNEIDVFKVYR